MGWSCETLLPLTSPPSITEGSYRSRGGSALLKFQSGEWPPGAASPRRFPGGESSFCCRIMAKFEMEWNDISTQAYVVANVAGTSVIYEEVTHACF